ncbi:MAG TPA: hypothetical protein VKM72_34775 [Thermoanaerobaculia bacterium]|nr:hypothetical protein [Thermoanaerobaculia bacterium]
MSKKIFPRLTAVTLAAALTLAGTAEAGPLSASAAGTEDSSWSLALEWLAEVWGDLTGLHSTTATDSISVPPDGGGTPTADVGCGIDPNGQCGG